MSEPDRRRDIARVADIAEMPIRWRRIPDSLTVSRVPIGIACGGALVADRVAVAGWLYVIGYLTDILDGWAARRAGVASPWGRRLDGVCDVTFHALVGAGLLARSISDHRWEVTAVVFAVWLAGQFLPRWIAVYSVAGKAVGGANRIALVGAFVALCPSASRLALVVGAVVVFGVTYWYEAKVTLAEQRAGERPRR